MSNRSLIDVINDKISVISAKQGVVLTERNRYYVLRHTQFTRRRKRWFSDTGSIPFDSVMGREDYESIKAALVSARDLNGLSCLDQNDLLEIDRAYEAYTEEAIAYGSRPNKEYVHKRFNALLRDFGIDENEVFGDVELFRSFLSKAILGPFWTGDYAVSRRNRSAVQSALLGGAKRRQSDAIRNEHFYDVLMSRIAVCEVLEGSSGQASAHGILMNRQTKHPTLERAHSLQLLKHFKEPRGNGAAQSLKWLTEGPPNAFGVLETPFIWIRSACSAIDQGYKLDDKPNWLPIGTVGDALRRGLDAFGARTGQAELNCEAYLARYDAVHGRVEQALEATYGIRERAGGACAPHLEAMLLTVEAMAFSRASKGGNKEYAWAARGKLSEIERLNKTLSVDCVWPFDATLIQSLKATCTQTLKLD